MQKIKQKSLRHLLSLLLAAVSVSSSVNAEEALVNSCSEPVDVAPLLYPQENCLKDGIWRKAEEYRKRNIAPLIPCNKVERIDSEADVFGTDDSEAALRETTFFKTFVWLGARDRFDIARDPDPFRDLNGLYIPENPILRGALPQTVHRMIEEAKANIFLDMFLLGGTWGVEITRDLLRAAQRGVKVVVLHDTESVFAVGNEIIPLWGKILEISAREPNLTALAANLKTPGRVSSVPFGLQGLLTQLAKNKENLVSPEGVSDHSKILIVDAVYENGVDEFLGSLQPKALVTSRNMVDSAGSYYFDESALIEGPAAVAAMLHFRSDLFWAWNQAMASSSSPYNQDDAQLMTHLLDKTARMSNGPLPVASRGLTGVEAVQISANDEVRNIDSGILRRVVDARSSIDIYGKIAYNWPLAIALKEAMARGVKVRMILDQQTTQTALLNAVLPYMIAQAPRRLPSGRTTRELVDENGRSIEEEDLDVHWHLSFRPGFFSDKKDRTSLSQEIHAKTLVVDGRYTFFGSTNFDSLTWAGGFREYSVWVDDPQIAAEVTQSFDHIYRHPLLSTSHKSWLGKAPSAPEAIRFMEALRAERSEEECPSKEAICNPETVLRGGIAIAKQKFERELVKTVMQRETERIKAVKAENFTLDAKGQVSCRVNP